MTSEQILNLLINNMKTTQNNMDYLTENVNKKIKACLEDETIEGKLDKHQNIEALLRHEDYCRSQKMFCKEIQQWAEEMLKMEVTE